MARPSITPLMTWQELEAFYGGTLVQDSKREGDRQTTPIRSFLTWLATNGSSHTQSLFKPKQGQPPPAVEPDQARHAIAAGLHSWMEETLVDKYAPATNKRRMAQVNRWLERLGRMPNRRYAPYTRKDLLDPVGGEYGIGFRDASAPQVPNDSIVQRFGIQLMSDTAALELPNAPIRHFLGWLMDNTTHDAVALRAALRSEHLDTRSNPQRIQTVVSCLNQWKMHASGKLSANTLGQYGKVLNHWFERLGKFPERSYPPYDRRLVSFRERKLGSAKSLGDLDWPELENLSGAARERKALQVLREAAVERLDALFRLHEFGQRVLLTEDPGDTAASESWLAIRRLLLRERETWRASRRSGFGVMPIDWSDEVKLSDPSVWINAGAPQELCNEQGFSLTYTVLCCIGPIGPTAALMMIAIACDTGFNKESITALPQTPFVYLSHDQAGLAQSGMLESFKARAGHAVFGYLNARSIEHRDDLSATWDSLREDYDAEAAVVSTATIDLIERYEKLTLPLRDEGLPPELHDKFLLHLTMSGISSMRNPDFRWIGKVPVVTRPGVNFNAIRKSFARANIKQTNSEAATRAAMGQSSHSVLRSAYLNSPELIHELEQSVSFVQNVLQSLIVRGKLEIQGKIPSKDIEWFSRLAILSGIESAVGINADSLQEAGPQIRFQPDDESLRELYVAYRALKAARLKFPLARWKVQALPLLGAVIALRRALFQGGLRPAYVSAAKKAYRDLEAGVIALPTILEA